jgi:hypothetical protein
MYGERRSRQSSLGFLNQVVFSGCFPQVYPMGPLRIDSIYFEY